MNLSIPTPVAIAAALLLLVVVLLAARAALAIVQSARASERYVSGREKLRE